MKHSFFTRIVFFTLLSSLFTPSVARAEGVTGTLALTIDGQCYEHKDVTLFVQKRLDGTVNISLKDFILDKGTEQKPLGNILLTDVTLSEGTINTTQTVTISASQGTGGTSGGDDSSPSQGDGGSSVSGGGQSAGTPWGDEDEDGPVKPTRPDDWLGPSYGPITITATGELYGDNARLYFDIYIPSQSKTIRATFISNQLATGLSSLRLEGDGASVRYTPSGIPVSSHYRGIIVRR